MRKKTTALILLLFLAAIAIWAFFYFGEEDVLEKSPHFLVSESIVSSNEDLFDLLVSSGLFEDFPYNPKRNCTEFGNFFHSRRYGSDKVFFALSCEILDPKKGWVGVFEKHGENGYRLSHLKEEEPWIRDAYLEGEFFFIKKTGPVGSGAYVSAVSIFIFSDGDLKKAWEGYENLISYDDSGTDILTEKECSFDFNGSEISSLCFLKESEAEEGFVLIPGKGNVIKRETLKEFFRWDDAKKAYSQEKQERINVTDEMALCELSSSPGLCLSELALRSLDDFVCGAIPEDGENIRSYFDCYFNLAKEKKDESLCLEPEEEPYGEWCAKEILSMPLGPEETAAKFLYETSRGADVFEREDVSGILKGRLVEDPEVLEIIRSEPHFHLKELRVSGAGAFLAAESFSGKIRIEITLEMVQDGWKISGISGAEELKDDMQ